MKLENGKPDRDLAHGIKLVRSYDKILKFAIRLGFSYNSDIATFCHNERAFWINKIEQDSDYELICKLWKDGTVHIYDRAEYLTHTQGKKVGTEWKLNWLRRQDEKKRKLRIERRFKNDKRSESI